MAKQKFRSKAPPVGYVRHLSKAARVEANRQRERKTQFDQGRALEQALAVSYLMRADGIGSGAEAAAALKRGEHRR